MRESKAAVNLSISVPRWMRDFIDKRTAEHPTTQSRSSTIVELLMQVPDVQQAAPSGRRRKAT